LQNPVKKSAYAPGKAPRRRPEGVPKVTGPKKAGTSGGAEPESRAAPKPSSMLTMKRKSMRKDKERTVPLRKASKRKPYYDSTDLTALTLMSKL